MDSKESNIKIEEQGKSGRYEVTLIKLGKEKVLYVTIPYTGCTKTPRCLFCGVQEERNKNLKINEEFGNEVLAKIKKYITKYSPNSLVLYNGGNILREEEMYQPTILIDIPKYIALHQKCKAYEIEARVDDVIRFQEKLKTIKSHLETKKLRIRLGIEFFDDELLKKHKKGNDTQQIQQAVDILNKLNIEWNGYIMLGGLDMKREEVIEVAIKTGKFMIDNNAFKVSINGIFVTKDLQRAFGNRIYVPDYSNLISVLTGLCKYKDKKQSQVLFKVGFEEEYTKNVVRFPYVSRKIDLKEVTKKLNDFNITQNTKMLS
ncbi:hypothetical protein KJA15_00400 [Patescibacteria group bacterium]|nr:hypothetical protein [Patescibacteria group bacterium]